MTRSQLEQDLEATIGTCSVADEVRLLQLNGHFQHHFEVISAHFYAHLCESDRQRFVQWFAKRWGNIDRVPEQDMRTYHAELERVRSHPYATQTLGGRDYKLLTLEPQGYRGELLTYPWMLGIHDFLFDQYQHGDFRVRAGDTIIDAGAFVGDTAVLFHQLAGDGCHIHAFEVLEENLTLLDRNLTANRVANCVTVNALALSDIDGGQVTIKAPAIQGATSIFGGDEGMRVETITIDAYVQRNQIERVDLIKMDIEGAERLALAGAFETIRRDRPRLAICLYHRRDDVIEIPRLIHATGVPYRFGFKWVELRNGWEAVLFALPEPEHDA